MSDAEFEYIGYIDAGDVVKYGPAPDNNACHVYRRIASAPQASQPPQGAEPDDLLRALRAAELDYTLEWGSGDLYGAAADEIEMLRAKQPLASQGALQLARQHVGRADDCGRLARAMLAASTPPATQEPVGEVVMFGPIKEVSWRRGRMPAVGTKLYAAPAPVSPEAQDEPRG